MQTPILCAILAGLVTFSSARPASDGGEAQLVDALRRAERTLTAQRYCAAHGEVLACLEPHTGAPYVLHHWNEIASLLERAAFGARFPPPDPTQLVSGEVLSYAPAQGTIDLEYSATRRRRAADPKKGLDLSDFQAVGEVSLHPLVFDGPYTIEIEGSGYPALAGSAQPPAIVCCSEFGENFVVSFGLSPQLEPGEKPHALLRAGVAHSHDGTSDLVAQAAPAIAPGAAYALKVSVDAASIQAFAQGELVMSAKKPDGLFGRFGLIGFDGVRSIRIRGKVEPSWLQGLADAAVQKQREKFQASYRAVDDAPGWLRARLNERSPAQPPFEERFPGADHAARRASLARVRAYLESNDARAGLEYVRSIADADTTPALRAWMEASLLDSAGDTQLALDAARRVLAADARFAPARALVVRCLARQQQRTTAIDECRTWLATEADRPEPYVQLASLCLYDDRAEEARATVRAAIDAGIPPGDLSDVERMLARAQDGPPWLTSSVYKSAHYEVRSDMGTRVCVLAATELEKFYVKYGTHLRRAPRGDRRLFRVYIFAGQASYLAYTQDLLGAKAEHTAGLYSPALKQLLIWNVPTFDQLLRTVRHEGFHQFLDRFSSDAPRWLDEGLAQYYESAKLVAGSWQDGAVAPEHVARLASKALVPLNDFLKQDARRFYAASDRELHYAQAWAFVHFLQRTSDENRRMLERLLDFIVSGTSPVDAVARVFDARTVATLDRDFAAYVRTLR